MQLPVGPPLAPSSPRFVWDAGSPSQDLSAEVTLTSLCCHPAGRGSWVYHTRNSAWVVPAQPVLPSLQGSLGKIVRPPPFPHPSLLSALLGCVETLGVARENRHPKGWDLGVEFVWGVFHSYYFFMWTLAENAKTIFSPL